MSVASEDVRQQPLNEANLQFIHDQDRVIWTVDRFRLGDPSCTLHRYVRDGGNPATGVEGTQVDQLNTDYECTFKDYSEHRIVNSGGDIQREDQEVVIYYFEPELSDVVELPKDSGRMWQIIKRTYHEPSGRCSIQARPLNARRDP